MKLNKIISVCLMLFSFSSFSSKWSLKISNVNVECQGNEQDRFWLCTSNIFAGIIDRKPIDKDMPFLLMLMKDEEVNLDLVIDTWVDDNNEDMKFNRNISFSHKHYYEINISSKDIINKNYLSSINDDQIKNLFIKFTTDLKFYFIDFKEQKIYQEIYEFEDDIYSNFVFTKKSEKKDSTSSIKVKDYLNQYYKNKYLEINNIVKDRYPSLEEANKRFKSIANDQSLSFKYTKDGCYARAHIVCLKLFNEHISTGKIWIAGNIKNPFNEQQLWAYHVAPIIYVQHDNGNIEKLVIDPAIDNTKLLTVDEWLTRYQANNAKKISFPIPSDSFYFEDVVLAYSSHIPLFPFCYECSFSLISSNIKAFSKNNQYLNKLLKNAH